MKPPFHTESEQRTSATETQRPKHPSGLEGEPPDIVKNIAWIGNNWARHWIYITLAGIVVGIPVLLKLRTPNLSPLAKITAPDNVVFDHAASIHFSGAESTDDGRLSSENYRWSVDGVPMHIGQTFPHAFQLPSRNTMVHVVELTVTDKNGQSGSAAIPITMKGPPSDGATTTTARLSIDPHYLVPSDLVDSSGFSHAGGRLEFNRDYDGNPLSPCVAMHPSTQATQGTAQFRVPEGAIRFKADFTMQGDRCGDSYGNATGFVDIFISGAWKNVWKGSIIGIAESKSERFPDPLDIPVQDATQIRLRVSTGERVWCEKVVWLGARFTAR